MNQITKMNTKHWIAEGLRSHIAKLEREIADFREQLKAVLKSNEDERPKTKKKSRAKGWTPERKEKFLATMKANRERKQAQPIPVSSEDQNRASLQDDSTPTAQ